MAEIKKEEQKQPKQDKKFNKEQILKSEKFANRRDLLNVLIKEDEKLSVSEVEKLLNKELKRKVEK